VSTSLTGRAPDGPVPAERASVRRAVRRPHGDRYLRLMLVSFAVSVLGTRVYLALADYPQVGGEVLHIAHALWGGLLLVVASVLPLVLANRWGYPVAAVLSGVGTGLFVDEVGKFITQDNDYFFPAAAPIVYALFLLTVFVYLQVRRPRDLDARGELYAALEGLEDVLDHDLEPDERRELQARLGRVVEQADSPDLRRLAVALREFLDSDASVVAARPGPLAWLRSGLRRWLARWVTEPRLRWGVVAGLTVLGLVALNDLVVIAAVAAGGTDGVLREVAELTDRLARVVVGTRALPVLLARAVLDAVVGVLLLVAAGLLALGRRAAAVRLATYGLLAALTVVNTLVFYFEQFLAAVGALAQATLLALTSAYARRYGRS
jgi:hypothetical protein